MPADKGMKITWMSFWLHFHIHSQKRNVDHNPHFEHHHTWCKVSGTSRIHQKFYPLQFGHCCPMLARSAAKKPSRKVIAVVRRSVPHHCLDTNGDYLHLSSPDPQFKTHGHHKNRQPNVQEGAFVTSR